MKKIVKSNGIRFKIVKYRWYHLLFDFIFGEPKDFNKITLCKANIEATVLLSKKGKISVISSSIGVDINEGMGYWSKKSYKRKV